MAICEIRERAHDVPLKFEVAHYVPEADGWRPSSTVYSLGLDRSCEPSVILVL